MPQNVVENEITDTNPQTHDSDLVTVVNTQDSHEEKRVFLFRLAFDEFAGFVAEGGQNLGVEEILGGRPNPVERTPALLRGYLALPFLSADVGIGEHV